jgi:anti-sigma regulatory factor (Ser/Thr protein kinase)
VREVLREWGLGDLAGDGEILASELLTNAVQASSALPWPGLLTLRLLAGDEQLVIEVYDHCPADPTPRKVTSDAEGGRGLVVIEALAQRWGYHRFHPALKIVWAELRISGR